MQLLGRFKLHLALRQRGPGAHEEQGLWQLRGLSAQARDAGGRGVVVPELP